MADKLEAVGTNRTYWDTITENFKNAWEKIEKNTFVNMAVPLEDLSEGHTEALLPMLIPAGQPVKTIIKTVQKNVPRSSRVSKKVTAKELERLVDEVTPIVEDAMQTHPLAPDSKTVQTLSEVWSPKISNKEYADLMARRRAYYGPRDAEAERIQSNYEKAMHRRRDYTYDGVGFTAVYENSPVYIGPDNKSMLIATGQRAAQPGELKMITHFAPETLRGGKETVEAALYAQDPIGFAVTEDLAPMLEKIGYTKVGEIPSQFNGEVVNKHVYVNRATSEKTLNDWLSKHGFEGTAEFPMLRSSDTPELHEFPIEMLIKRFGGKMNYLEYFKKGGIHIKKSHEGKFTDYCGGKVTEECIARGKSSKDPKVRKMATFAQNARTFKHQSGGRVYFSAKYDPIKLDKPIVLPAVDKTSKTTVVPTTVVYTPDTNFGGYYLPGYTTGTVLSSYVPTFVTDNMSTAMQGLQTLFVKYQLPVTMTSGYRKDDKTSNGADSKHASGDAMDIVPMKGYDFEEIKSMIRNTPEIFDYMKANHIGLFDETSQATLAKTKGTGPHFHIGTDKVAQEFLKV